MYQEHYSGLIKPDTLILDNTIHYRGEHKYKTSIQNVNTKRQYKTYTSEFKSEALALISDQGYTVQEAASALGVANSLLYSWKQKAE